MAEAKKTKQDAKSKESKILADKGAKEEKNGINQESAQVETETDSKRKEIKHIESEETVATDSTGGSKSLAKSGKRSAKALKDAEEKQAKEERKAANDQQQAESQTSKPKPPVRTAGDRLKTRGKKYQDAYKKIDQRKTYSVKDALDLAIATSVVKFDATLEIHVRLGVDPKQADQNIRGNVVLPAGSGKTVRVAVFGEPEDIATAKNAGADIAESDELLQKLDKQKIEFDVLISTPSMMARLGKYARVLGPKGLMPNPKSGTVTKDIAKAVTEAKGGRIEFRVDSAGIIHVGVGKVSFGSEKLLKNVKAVLASIKSAKPASVKGNYVLSVYVTTSMGPSVRIDASELNNI